MKPRRSKIHPTIQSKLRVMATRILIRLPRIDTSTLGDPNMRITTFIAPAGYCKCRTLQFSCRVTLIGATDTVLRPAFSGFECSKSIQYLRSGFTCQTMLIDYRAIQVRKRFGQNETLCFEWSSGFETDHKQQLMDKYSLPDQFVHISFPTVEDQRAAIIKWNRKQLGFKGPRLLVQRYLGTGSTFTTHTTWFYLGPLK
jgi:hypothetical protein